ncbi:M55 family metallopeptidase [Aeropyrum camini]|uniref:D-aminopeptidase DppA n=1 Tax=Aeropyrum camini SY1 = JCM 12091 TaxID=1198449 RepID=U3TCE7_9CREN|nr:M55 family metallopeptidase [Aeropyrum camini]BAN89705.1 D-aminopeptidase DppA [Aeropyrum camini SY1 = JCM 12091]
MARFFVSVDAEGMPYSPSRVMMMPGDPLYGELRRIMTRVTNIVVEELFASGAEGVVVADSHGAMVNLDPFEIDGRAELVRGFPRPLAMINGARGCRAALFIGYHGSPQSGGVLGHTYAGRILQRVKVQGSEAATEYLLNTYALGEMGVPVVAVAGDSVLEEEVRRHTPWARFVALKRPASSLADVTPPWRMFEESLRRAVREAVAGESLESARPVRPREPWIEVELKRPWHADVAELFPCVERIDGVTVRLSCGSFLENYKLLEGVVMASYSLER